MIWALILVVVMIVFAAFLYADDYGIILGSIMWNMMLFLGLIVLGLMLTLSSCFINKSNYTYELTKREDIIALQDSTGGTVRHGFMGSAYINNSLYYYYMTDTEYGYKAGKIDAGNTYVRYCEDGKPIVETYSASGFTNKWYYLFAFPMDTYYIAYIPEGSIIENYQIDLK